MRIALFSPNKNPYSETFIQAQKTRLAGKVFYYFGRGESLSIEGERENITRLSLMQRILKWSLNKKTHLIRATNVATSLKRKKIDVILIQYGNHAFDLMAVLRKVDIPFIVHFHGYDASVKDVVKSTNYYKEVFERAAYVISVSRKMHQMLLDLGCPSNKLVLNTYGPNPIFFDIQPNFTKKVIISIGRFVDKKAPHLTIMAFAKALKVHPDAKLIMAGDGVLKSICFDLAVALDCERSIEFIGVIKPDDFKARLVQVRAFVQHSKTALNGDMEGTPLAVLEASAAGIPVVSTFHAGISDVIKHGRTGLLCEEGDVETMAEHIIQLLDNPDYAQRLGLAGKIRIKDHFSMDRYINKLNEIIRLSGGA